MIDTYEGNIQ